MIQVSIIAGTLCRPTLEGTLDAVAAYGIRNVEFDLACSGVPTLPERVDHALAARIAGAHAERGITMAAISGRYNMIHPDRQARRAGMHGLRVLAETCPALGTMIITLSTGTRDPENMWRRHEDNDSTEAWSEMIEAVGEAARIAEEAGVLLAFEPEVTNVVDSAIKARRLIDELGSPAVKVLMDGANLFHTGELPRMREILDEAFALLGPDIVLAHAKDLTQDGEAGHEAAGHGLLDYDRYMALLQGLGRDVPLILHSLREEDVLGCIAFLRAKGALLTREDAGEPTSL
jgi:sugar phosphate isomerase/epimerase